jgi:hypothetical protein
VRAIAEEARRYVGQTIVTTDGYQVSEEGCHGSMIIQQGGIPHTNNSGMDIITVCLTKREAGGFEMMGHICYIYVDTKLDDNIYTLTSFIITMLAKITVASITFLTIFAD